MNKKPAFAFFLGAVLLGTSCSSSLLGGSKENVSSESSQNAAPSDRMGAEASEAKTPDPVPVLTKKRINEKDKKNLIEISAEYPQMSGVESSEHFNQLVQQTVRKRINDFKRDVGEPYSEDRARSIDIDYVTSVIDGSVASFIFYDSEDTGGAHPNTVSFTINYDVKAGREISLAELFKTGAPYLSKMSQYCIGRLKKQIEKDAYDDAWVKEGAGPKRENFRSWAITEKGFKITFDSYQVAAYAYGPQEVVIPFSVLSDAMDSDTPVSHLVSRG